MIAVVGCPALLETEGGRIASGPAGTIALAAAAAGSEVQLVGKVGDDPDGDALLLGLAAGGVGHVALLRDPAHRTPVLTRSEEGEGPLAGPPVRVHPGEVGDAPALEPADVELGLRYLTEFRVIVLADPPSPGLVPVIAAAAAWSGAALVVLVPEGVPAPAGLPEDAVVLVASGTDPDGAIHGLVGRVAAALDAGRPAEDALRDSTASQGWEPAAAEDPDVLDDEDQATG
jgi:sugar/nucleoside kinase (ribokinase family)